MLPHKRPALAMSRLIDGDSAVTAAAGGGALPGDCRSEGFLGDAMVIDLTASKPGGAVSSGGPSKPQITAVAPLQPAPSSKAGMAPQRPQPAVPAGAGVHRPAVAGMRLHGGQIQGQGVIEQHFLSSHCALCDDQTLRSQTLCRRCLADPQVRS